MEIITPLKFLNLIKFIKALSIDINKLFILVNTMIYNNCLPIQLLILLYLSS